MSTRWLQACVALTCAALAIRARANAAPAVVVDEPEVRAQPGKIRVQVLDDGTATLRLKAGAPGAAPMVDLSLSAFAADGQSAAVGFEPGAPEGRAPLPYLRGLAVAPDGTEVRLAAPGLTPDVEYVGSLAATVGRRVTLTWTVALVRRARVPPFRCPTGAQLVAPDGSTSVDLRALAPTGAKTVGLRLSSFVSREQELGDVGFAAGGSGGEFRRELTDVPVAGEHLVPPIRALGLTEGATYSGKLTFLVDSREVMQCALDLLLPKTPKGELVTDTQAITRTVTLPFFFGDAGATAGVRLFEKSRARRIEAITAVLDSSTETPEGTFDLDRHVRFALNEKPVKDFTLVAMPIADPELRTARTLKPGEQKDVAMTFRNLSAGKYAFAIRFASASATATSPKLDVTLNVRHHWLWAVLAVLAALVLSFFITKGIANWRERLRVRARVAQLRTERFEEHVDLPSVVFLRAVLDQTEKFVGRMWLLPPPASVYDHLARAERVVAVMRRYSSLQDALEAAASAEPVVEHRYRDAIAEVMQRIGPQPLDQKTADGIVEDLGAIATRLSDPIPWYWTALKADAQKLARQASAVEKNLGDTAVVGPLIAKLKSPPPAPEPSFDDAYWVVRLLYSRQAFPREVAAIVAAYNARQSLKDAFAQGDALAWQRLQAAVEAKTIQIAPVDAAEQHEALSPSRFKLHFDDPSLGESYLVCNMLTYAWKFDLTPDAPRSWWERFRARGHQRTSKTWDVALSGARVTQYAPFPGTMKVGVTIRWSAPDGPKSLVVGETSVPVARNSELSLHRALNGTELLVLGIVTAIALATALPSLYFGKATFGSFTDYVAILAWAVGIDQGKNLIQALKVFPADAATPPTAGS